MYEVLKEHGGGMKGVELVVALCSERNPGEMNIFQEAASDDRIGELEYRDPNYDQGDTFGRVKSFFYIK